MTYALGLVLILAFSLSGCARFLQSQSPPASATAGFWLWEGNSTFLRSSREPLDVLFVHVGSIRKDPYAQPNSNSWSAYGAFPRVVPEAREIWAVYRYEQPGVPDIDAAAVLARDVAGLLATARRRHLHLRGVQLDIDSPTGSLQRYSSFLREFRKQLPRDCRLSITTLLDWFRSGTDIAEVIEEVEEFVPQFYDLGGPETGPGTAIASRIDAARWGPVFNRFGKPFRIGISSFGRARLVTPGSEMGARPASVYYGDLAPIDVGPHSAFQLTASRNPANELILSYRATRNTRIGYNEFGVGDTVEFVVSTPESIRAAVAAARQMGGHMSGVVFFRWPAKEERLTMQPDEVLAAAGLTAQPIGQVNRIHTVNGRCAAVTCIDLYLESADPFSQKAIHYRILSTADMEYFLPEPNMPVRMSSTSQLEILLPPYCGRGRLMLGRAVTMKPVEFSLQEIP